MKRLLFAVALACCILGPRPAFADTPLAWDTPYGTIGLPLQATEALIGYDGILKQAIAGFSVPVYQDPKGIIALQLGAVAPWQTNGPTIEPYVAAGHDFAKEIPFLAQYNTVHLNVFGRYSAQQGKAGAGVTASYSFGGGTVVAPSPAVPPVTPPVPATSRLNLLYEPKA